MRLPNLATFADGRKPIKEIYAAVLKLRESGWILDVIALSSCVYRGKKMSLPIIALKTPNPTAKALWLISGIHGEEPAGPNAISDPEAIEAIGSLSRKIPIVLLPLCNPLGYLRNWRYLNQEKWNPNAAGQSVGDSEHYLPDFKNSDRPRRERPSSPEAAKLTAYVVETSAKYRPLVSLDLHEDNLISKGYVYSQGRLGPKDEIAQRAVRILLDAGVPIQTAGKTRFGETITDGIVGNEKDGSIDELLSTDKIIVDGRIIAKPAAATALVIETPAKALGLDERKRAHLKILTSLESLL